MRTAGLLAGRYLVLVVVLSLVACTVVLLVARTSMRDDGRRNEIPPSTEFEVIRAAAARIAAQSQDERSLESTIELASPHDERGRLDPVAERVAPQPPQGYSFVEHRGEMRTGRIRQAAPQSEPPADGPDWLSSSTGVSTLLAQAAMAGRDWTFGWIRLAADARLDDLTAALGGTGAEIVGSTGRLVRARLPADRDRLEAIAAMSAVDGLGGVPPDAKTRWSSDPPPNPGIGEPIPVFVTLMADEEDGRWRRALEDLGAVVGGYDRALRVYRANAAADVLDALAAADFVLAVEPVGIVRAAHDTAVPAMGADALRAYDGAPGIFSGTGGSSVVIGVADSGLNVNHVDIASHRDSICGENFVFDFFDPAAEAADLWIDAFGHGTNVVGTMAGNGSGDRRFAGMAPSVRHVRFAKVLNRVGFGDSDTANLAMDYLASASGCDGSTAEKPSIVNLSLTYFQQSDNDGRSVSERKLDATVWGHRQLYVVAQANGAINGYSEFAAAKNSLAVGSVLDSGELAYYSSRGPTVDGRLVPNVVATGVSLHTAAGDGSRNGYALFNGTSAAAPAAAGVAALLMDAVPVHRGNPALTRARLMASAIRPNAWLDDPAAFPHDNSAGPGVLQNEYGLGKVSARVAALDRDEPEGWTGGSATAVLADGEYASQEIVVPDGAHRLDLVLTWDEPPAEAIEANVLNDLDLWLDHEDDCATAACGEFVSSSRVDNVEWIFIRNPTPGTYTAKVVAERIYGESPSAALAWTVIRGASTPTLSVAVDKDALAGAGEHEVTVTLRSDAFVAAGTRLHLDCDDASDPGACDRVSFTSMAVSREDGVSVDLTKDIACRSDRTPCPVDSIELGALIPLGEVALGEAREVTFVIDLEGEQTARLLFTANAWNAVSGSASVQVGTEPGSMPARPPNDDFAAASEVSGEEGSAELSLLRASTEPGEPALSIRVGLRQPARFTPARDDYMGRPAGSAWYAWTAPASGSFHFRVGGSDSGERVDIYAGQSIASLDTVGTGWGGASVFAEPGRVYRVRVSNFGRGGSVTLRWSRVAAPENDDFAAATVIEGDRGTVLGSTLGATLEPGESLGGLAATVWYRWTAPRDGMALFWMRRVDQRMLAFEGNDMASRRLVSGVPYSVADFPVKAGTEYRMAAAEQNAYTATGPFELNWSLEDIGGDGNDWLGDAASLGNAGSSAQTVDVDQRATVEPGEPGETGVRTKWWVWEAPADGRYTWLVERDPFGRDTNHPLMRVTAFAGPDTGNAAFADLATVGQAGPNGTRDLQFEATGGSRYWFATGLVAQSHAAYTQRDVSASLAWGETPSNDNPGSAEPLSGVTGSVSGSNRYASTGSGPDVGSIGSSTLWWTYEAEADGWMRFAVDGSGLVLTIHGDGADGNLEIVASSRWQSSSGRLFGASAATEVRFWAAAGVRYTISVGVDGTRPGRDFTMDWEETEEPGWLRYAGRLMDGDWNSQGTPVEIRRPAAMAVHASGTPLYLASSIGLQVFERDAATDRLDFLQLLDVDLARSSLLWDAPRDRLLAEDCGTWRAFAPVAGGAQLEGSGELTAAGEPARCGNGLLMDSTGSSLYRVGDGYVDWYSVDQAGDLTFEDGYETPGVRSAAFDNDDDRVYALADSELVVFDRDDATGRLARRDNAPALDAARALAIADDGEYLFVLGRGGEETLVYGLQEDDPEHLASATRFWTRPRDNDANECRFAAIRSDRYVIDAFCQSSAFTAEWHPADQRVEGTDYIAHWQPDRYNNAVPDFDFATAMLASPDGLHVYLTTPTQGILTFARGMAGDAGAAGEADLVIQSQWASDISTVAGAAFSLHAVVRNRGDGASSATTMRAYRSEDAEISLADSEIGSVDFAGLEVSATRGGAVTVTAPADPGAYYYGLCVDAVAGESDTSNNCSAAVTVMIEDTRRPDLVVESPAVSATTLAAGETFTFSATVRNQGDGEAGAATLRYFRSTDADIGTDDTEVGTTAVAGLPAASTSEQSTELAAPSDAGTYYYGACIDAVARESDTSNNCSSAVSMTVTAADEPDLAVESPSVSSSEPAPEETFTLNVVVRNAGTAESSATTLRYYRSDDDEISSEDTEVGTAAVDALGAGATSAQSIDLEAPAALGTYYYGACVDADPDDPETGNNCSPSVEVTVTEPPVGETCQIPVRRASGLVFVEIGPDDVVDTSTGTAEEPFVQEGTFDAADDVHAYAITIDADTRLEIKAGGGLDTQTRFVRNDCTRAGRYWNDAEWHENYASGDYEIYVAGNLGPGTYYLVVFTWAGATGDYGLDLWTEDQPENEAPDASFGVSGEEVAVDDSATLTTLFADDDGDWLFGVSFDSADDDIATADVTGTDWDYYDANTGALLRPWNGGVQHDRVIYSVSGHQEGTTTITMTARDQRGGSSSWSFEVDVEVPTADAPTVASTGTNSLDVSFEVTLGANETRAYDVQIRRKDPQSTWWPAGTDGCLVATNDTDEEVTRTEVVSDSGFAAGYVYEARYRSRNAEACDLGDPDPWSALGEASL